MNKTTKINKFKISFEKSKPFQVTFALEFLEIFNSVYKQVDTFLR